jgi:hypothetical protein
MRKVALLFIGCLIVQLHAVTISSPQGESGLVASWTFDSVAGNTYYDVTEHGYDAVLTGSGPSFVQGIKGNAINCPGSIFNIAIANSKDSFALNHFTVELWYSPNLSTVNFQEKIFEYSYITSGVRNGFSLFRDGNATAAFCVSTYSGDNWLTINSKEVLTPKQWYHLVASYDSSTMKLYVNGVLVSSMSYSGGIRPTGSNAHIGSQPRIDGSTICPVNGRIDEVKLYNYALAADSIAAHYNVLKPQQPIDTAKVVASWTFDSVAGNTYYDVTGHGYDAVATGDSVRITSNGISGKALECRGVASDNVFNTFDVRIKNSLPNFNFPKFTIETWIYSYVNMVNPGSFYNVRSIFENATVGLEGSGTTGGYMIGVNDRGKLYFTLSGFSGNWITILSDSILLPNRWYHIAAIYDGQKMKLLVNGELAAQLINNAGYKPSSTPSIIGAEYQYTTGNEVRTRRFFNGKIDELKLYNYPLDSQTVWQHYAKLMPVSERPFKINFGMKTSYCNPGDTVWMPIYLTNFENYAINACQFSLAIDTTKLELLTISKDSGLVAKSNWVLDWNRNTTGSIAVGLMGTNDSIQYGEGEFVRCKFQVKSNVRQGDTCFIRLENIQIDERYNLVSASTVPGKIVIKKPSVIYGDVTGDGNITIFDARGILSYVIGSVKLPDANYPNFTPTIADVSGDGTISSYDAALVFLYSLGMISEFPVVKKSYLSKSLSKTMESVPSQAVLSISPASQNSADGTKFNIIGSNLNGFLAGEFSVSYDPTAFDVNKGVVNTTLRSATLYSRIDETARRIKIALATKDEICTSEPVVLATITIPANSSSEQLNFFRLATALINEGKIPSNVTAGSVVGTLPDAFLKSKMNAREIVFMPTKLMIRSDASFTRVQIFNLAGRMVANTFITANGQACAVIDLKQLRHGTYLYRIAFGAAEVRTGRIVIGR